LHVSMIRKWCHLEEEIRAMASIRGVVASDTKRLKGPGRIPIIKGEVEEALMSWFDSRRDKDNNTKDGPLRVNISHCIIKLIQLDSTLSIVARNNLRRRVWRIFRRKKITDRAVTHYAQKCRNSTNMIEGWQQYICQKMTVAGIPLENITNFDQTNVMFSSDGKRTLAHKGAKTVSALKGSSTQRCTVMLGATATGHKFPPYIIFKGRDTAQGTINRRFRQVDIARQATTTSSDESFKDYPLSNFYAVQDNAWMCSRLVVDWVNKVYKPWAATKTGPTMLILDEFSGHQTAEVRDAVADCGAFLEFIPGGYTWCLQPMDVGVNRPFKDGIRRSYDAFCIESDFNKKPRREDVSRWVKVAYDGVKVSTLQKTFKKIGIVDKAATTATSITIAATTGTAMGEETKKEDEEDDDDDMYSEVDYLDLNKEETQQSIEEYEADKLYCDVVDEEYNDNDDA
jgi:hypothetical protein